MNLPIVEIVLAQYELGKLNSIQSLGNAGGFSGAQLWKVACDRGEFCLRQWPLNSQVDVAAIHAVLKIAEKHDVPVAAPILNRAGQTLSWTEGKVAWELAPWLSGAADFNERPSLARLREAVSALASFHEVTSPTTGSGQSPGLAYRLDYLRRAPRLISDISPEVQSSGNRIQSLATIALPKIAQRIQPIQSQLNSFSGKTWRLVNAICDIHHDHLFFAGESLTGIVDFGALKRDSPCFDLARLISSLRLDGRSPWDDAFEMYSEFRKLTPIEMKFALTISECSELLGFLNWMKWIFLDKREFEDWPAIENRLNRLFARFAG